MYYMASVGQWHVYWEKASLKSLWYYRIQDSGITKVLEAIKLTWADNTETITVQESTEIDTGWYNVRRLTPADSEIILDLFPQNVEQMFYRGVGIDTPATPDIEAIYGIQFDTE